MSGKAYTMKEMKSIVDYLTEHKAYNEIKGRKMWVDFERSKILDRTWQSLKETFLKRILPDIHNPYYQLSVTQISSFRNGYDVEAKVNNKLEIRTVSEESNIDTEQAINTEHPSTSNANASGNKSGEDTITTKTISLHRSSAETVVIDTCYDTAEDLLKELEGIDDNEKNNSNQTTQKSLRDFITYSEPLIPAIQDVINDFATDEDPDTVIPDTKMGIVKNIAENSKANDETMEAIVISDTEDVCNQNVSPDQSEKNVSDQDNEVTIENNEQLNKTGQVTQNATDTSVQEISSTEDVAIVQSSSDIDTDKNKDFVTSNNAEDVGTDSIQNESEKTNNGEEVMTQNTTSNTTDTLIPNNQEALNSQCEMVSQTKDNESKTTEDNEENQSKPTEDNEENQSKPTENNEVNQSKPTEKDHETQVKINNLNKRKRAASQGPAVPIGKRNLIKNSKSLSVSDTDVGIKEKQKDSKILPKTYSKPKSKKLKMSDTEKKEQSIPDGNTKELEKVTEINEDEIPATDVTKIQPSKNFSPEIENPCLKSVSLYEEEFTTTRYSESSDAGVPEAREKRKEKTDTKNSDNDILQLKSHSESHSKSHSETERKRKSPPVRGAPTKSEREKILANVFGFSSGALRHGRKRRISHRKSAPRQPRTRILSSDSSEWTSESDTECISPPRGRKDRHPLKYLRQKPARIYSLEENGGLFVMYGKKIYPVVKEGKSVKGYVTYASERDSGGEDESYWKNKYMEEKKRAAQLTKLLHQSENNNQPQSDRCSEVDLTNPSPPKIQKMSTPRTDTKLETPAIPEDIPNKTTPEVQKVPELPKEVVRNEPVKIKITKQNKEIELEGHWSQLHPIFDHVYEIFHKQVEPVSESKPSPPPKQSKTCLSGLSTPIIPHVDPVAHATVSKLETEIFAEINARDKMERSITPLSLSSDSSKISQRNRNEHPKSSKKAKSSASLTPEIKKNELNTSDEVKIEQNMKKKQNSEIEQNIEKLASGDGENKTSPTTPRRVTRTSMNALRESIENKVTIRTKKGKESADVTEDEDNVRYKFPSPPRSVRKATRSTANKTKLTKNKNAYVKKAAAVSTLDTAILNIIESSQGYQDSDVSPPKLLRKRKLRRNTFSDKIRPFSRKNRRRSQLNYYEMSDQSSNSCPNLGLISKSTQKEGFISNSDIYRSESFQLLMPKEKTNIRINPTNVVLSAFSEQLERIINNASKNNTELPSTDKDLLTLANISNGNSSSNVSLPPSPILSIVENLSIDKNSVKGYFDDNVHEHQIGECNNNDLLTNEDVTMLLMGQDCDNQATTLNNAEQNNQNSENAMDTDSILNKLCAVNLNQDNPTISDSLHQKIRNLLLESTKKMQPTPQVIEPRESSAMDVDTAIEVDKNKRPNKRCSTPLKRQISKKTKKKNPRTETFIEEEHTDSCSQSTRRSCPPLTCNPSNMEYLNPESANQAKKPRNSRGRKNKEDIIKVKILRPKARSHSREILRKQDKDRETKSVHSDSGINETESSIHQQLDKSVELIHNHSETCLQTDECLDNSIEYVESHKSLICVTDSDLSNNIEVESQAGTDFVNHTLCELLIGDSAANISCNVIQTIPAIVSGNEALLSRESPNSLITEDLSEPDQEQISDRASRWYLLSEDENTNTNFPQHLDFGSDLDKLFPVACAVPNLSTITEMSKENDNKPVNPDEDTRNDLLSQSLFDSNF